MPWRNLPPDIIQGALHILGLAVAGLLGSASRIAEQIAQGERAKVWGKELVTDAISLLLMLLVALAIVEQFALEGWRAVAVSGILGRSGTPILDKLIHMGLSAYRGTK